MVNVNYDYEIKRLQEFYAIYTKRVEDNRADFWHTLLKDFIIPDYNKKLAELYSLRDTPK